jgi:hypothetical protein
VADVRSGRGKKRLRMRDARQRLKSRRGFAGVPLRQAVNLLDVKDRVALHVVDFAVGF